MAIKTIKATIQMRKGLEQDFDADQMTAGEWAVSTDKKYVRMCFAPGIVVRMATYEAFEQDMREIQTILATCQDIQIAVDAMANLVEQHRDDAAASAKEADDYFKLSKSYAVGTEGEARENDDIDNSKYYYEQSKRLTQGFNGIVPMGTIAFSELDNQENQVPKYMFNISDAFTSDSRFKDGGGIYYGAGNNVVYTADEKWDVLAAANVTGVKGKNETTYRQGNVNITAENVGALPITGGTLEGTSNPTLSIKRITNGGSAGFKLIPSNGDGGGILFQSNYRESGNQFLVIRQNELSEILNLFVVSETQRQIHDYKSGTLKEILVQGDASSSLELLRAGNATTGASDANYKPGKDTFEIKEFGGTSDNLPTNSWYHILTGQGNDNQTNYVTQLALGMTTEAVFYRAMIGGVWKSWHKVAFIGDDIGNCIVNGKKLSDSLSGVGLSNALVGVQANTLNELVEKIMYSPNLRSASGNVKIADGVIAGIIGWNQFVATWQNRYDQTDFDIGLIIILSCSVFTNKLYRISIDGMNGSYEVKKVEYVEFGADGTVTGKVNLTNNLLANVAGVSALDAAVGPVIQGQIDDINSNLSELSGSLLKCEVWSATVTVPANDTFHNAFGIYKADLNITSFSGYDSTKWANKKIANVYGKNTNRDGNVLAYGIASGNTITINTHTYGTFSINVAFIY